MCEFCHKHGEGQKWYLRAENYSEDLLSDLRRRRFIDDFFRETERVNKGMDGLERFRQAPSFVQSVISPFLISRQKKIHYGQVVPIEEVERIMAFVNSVVRMPCACRHALVGTEQRYCYGVSMVPNEQSGFLQIAREAGADWL